MKIISEMRENSGRILRVANDKCMFTGDLVVMSIETYEAMVENAAMDAAISDAEAEFARDGQLHDAREALASLRRKHFE